MQAITDLGFRVKPSIGSSEADLMTLEFYAVNVVRDNEWRV